MTKSRRQAYVDEQMQLRKSQGKPKATKPRAPKSPVSPEGPPEFPYRVWLWSREYYRHQTAHPPLWELLVVRRDNRGRLEANFVKPDGTLSYEMIRLSPETTFFKSRESAMTNEPAWLREHYFLEIKIRENAITRCHEDLARYQAELQQYKQSLAALEAK